MFESSLSRGGSPDPPEICVIRVSPLLAGTEAGPTKTIDRHTGRVRLRRTRSGIQESVVFLTISPENFSDRKW
jgi:hypothetical protein